MKNIIIDTDPGHDDALAIMLLLAHRKKFNILGFVTVAGNQTIEKVTKNMCNILNVLKFDYPIAKGSEKPLFRRLETEASAHGESGLDGPILPEPDMSNVIENGIDFMYEQIMNNTEKTNIIALGPLTNIANLINKHPDVIKKIEMISMMGGGIDFGNVTTTAEFNIYIDPEAAEIVFDSGIKIVMSGLDVTEKALIYEKQWENLDKQGPVGKFTKELFLFYTQYSKKYDLEGSSVHDACAVAYLLKPELFTGKMYNVHIETEGKLTRGMTVADKRNISSAVPNIKVLLDLNQNEFIKFMLDAISDLDKRIKKIT